MAENDNTTTSTKRGRWYEAMGGLGLERQTGSADLEFRWQVVGYIETKGKRSKVFNVRVGQEEAWTLGTYRTIDEAKERLLRYGGVTEADAPERPTGDSDAS